MHKCIMVKVGGNEKHKVCERHVNFTKSEGKLGKVGRNNNYPRNKGEMYWNSENCTETTKIRGKFNILSQWLKEGHQKYRDQIRFPVAFLSYDYARETSPRSLRSGLNPRPFGPKTQKIASLFIVGLGLFVCPVTPVHYFCYNITIVSSLYVTGSGQSRLKLQMIKQQKLA